MKKPQNTSVPDFRQTKSEYLVETTSRGELRPPSPVRSFSESAILTAVMRRLTDLEEKVESLETKPLSMPFAQEELLNSAVYRVEALEAELIATKKVTSPYVQKYHLNVFMH